MHTYSCGITCLKAEEMENLFVGTYENEESQQKLNNKTAFLIPWFMSQLLPVMLMTRGIWNVNIENVIQD
jgi:hypothetical protein